MSLALPLATSPPNATSLAASFSAPLALALGVSPAARVSISQPHVLIGNTSNTTYAMYIIDFSVAVVGFGGDSDAASAVLDALTQLATNATSSPLPAAFQTATNASHPPLGFVVQPDLNVGGDTADAPALAADVRIVVTVPAGQARLVATRFPALCVVLLRLNLFQDRVLTSPCHRTRNRWPPAWAPF